MPSLDDFIHKFRDGLSKSDYLDYLESSLIKTMF